MATLSALASSDLARQFDALAATWDAEHGPASVRAPEFAARVRCLRAHCRELGRPRVLDLGCATGWTLLALSDLISAGTGVDVAPAMIEQGRRNSRTLPVRFQLGDAVEFCSRSEEQFDLVLLIGVLAHLPDPRAALAGIKRVLAMEGRLVVITPHPWGPAVRLRHSLVERRATPPVRHLSPSGLRTLANGHGFELSALEGLPYAPWPRLRAFCRRCRTRAGMFRRNPLTGLVCGAYAAVLQHSR